MCELSVYCALFSKSQSRPSMSAATEWLSGCFPSTSADRAAEVLDELSVERPDEQAERIVSSLVLGIRAEHRDGAAQAVVLQNQLETLAWVHPLLKRNLDRRAQGFLRLRCVQVGDVERFQRPYDRTRIADGAEIGPCVRNVSIGQNQFADFACRLNVPVLIVLLHFFRHIIDASAGNQRQA